jgi:hypothetical protein
MIHRPKINRSKYRAWRRKVFPYFPNTASDLIIRLGSPVGATPSGVLAIYKYEDNNSQKDILGLGPDLIAGGLTNQECIGIPSFPGKIGCKLAALGNYFQSSSAAPFDVNGNIRCFLLVTQIATNVTEGNRIISKEDISGGWGMAWDYGGPGSGLYVFGGGKYTALGGSTDRTGGWHSYVITIDDVAKVVKICSGSTSASSGVYSGTIQSSTGFSIGRSHGNWASAPLKIAYLAVTDFEISNTALTTFWSAFI